MLKTMKNVPKKTYPSDFVQKRISNKIMQQKRVRQLLIIASSKV